MPFDIGFDRLIKSSDIYCLGDSLTAPGSSDWVSYGAANAWAGKRVQNSSTGGIGSAAILARQVSDLAITSQPYRYRKTYIWAGENDMSAPNWDPSLILTNTAAIVANCVPGNFRVFQMLPKSLTSTFFTGGTDRVKMDLLNTELAAVYGSAFIWTLAALQAGGNGSTQDNADIANGVVPTSLRQASDGIHMTLIATAGLSGGNGIVYQQVLAAA